MIFLLGVLLILVVTLAIGMVGYLFFFALLPMARGAFYAGTREKVLYQMLSLSRIQSGEKVVDLGSGDGRLVIAFAKAGAYAQGYEINPILVWLSRRKIQKLHLEARAEIYWKDFWSISLRSFALVSVYGVPSLMQTLEEKLQKELQPGARVVSNGFAFPAWPCAKNVGRVYLYKKTFSEKA